MDDLEAWMTEAGETDETLSVKLGVSRVQVSRLRRRICNPSLPIAEKLETLTAIPALELLKRERVA